MPISLTDVERELVLDREPVSYRYCDRDTLIYAIAIGMGKDPLDYDELGYVCETVDNRVVPTVATVLLPPSLHVFTTSKLLKKMNFDTVLHGEQRLRIHQPIPAKANTLVSNRIAAVLDKGAEKGAVVIDETEAKLEDGSPLYTASSSFFYRGDGGFGGLSEGALAPHALPERKPDVICELKQRPDQAILYALCGDRNPLHREPRAAANAGYSKPVLHGFCSYGIACHAVLKSMLNYDHTMMKSFDVRFTSPVFPGETHIVEMWRDQEVISFRTRIKERDIIALDNGKCLLNYSNA